MSNVAYAIFCEGESDGKFLADLLTHLGIDNVAVTPIKGGVATLGTVAPQIRQAVDSGKVALILDGNHDVDRRRGEIQTAMIDEDLAVDDVFLLPNNCDPGCLETLLEQLGLAEHQAIHDCFEEYKRCLAKRSSEYRMPSGKGKIYAYCDALGREPRAPRRNYLDDECWDLGSVAVRPLRKFLRDWTGWPARRDEAGP